MKQGGRRSHKSSGRSAQGLAAFCVVGHQAAPSPKEVACDAREAIRRICSWSSLGTAGEGMVAAKRFYAIKKCYAGVKGRYIADSALFCGCKDDT